MEVSKEGIGRAGILDLIYLCSHIHALSGKVYIVIEGVNGVFMDGLSLGTKIFIVRSWCILGQR